MTKKDAIKNLKELIAYFEQELNRAEPDQWIEYGFDVEEGKGDVETFKKSLNALEITSWISTKDRNPEETGTYLVTLEHNKWVDGEEIDEIETEVDTRWYGDSKICPDWRMDDQPGEGLAWTEQCGSIKGERVVAWMPLPIAYGEVDDDSTEEG